MGPGSLIQLRAPPGPHVVAQIVCQHDGRLESFGHARADLGGGRLLPVDVVELVSRRVNRDAESLLSWRI